MQEAVGQWDTGSDPQRPPGEAHPASPGLGTVYGVVLNDFRSLERMGAVLEQAPYKGRPQAPVLYIKPRNTHACGPVVKLPRGAGALEVGATLGVVIGADAARVQPGQAAAVIDGYRVVADLSLPHESYYRPAIREKCFDGSCVTMPAMLPAAVLGDPAGLGALNVVTTINGRQVDAWPLAALVRGVPDLIAAVTDFMTLRRGDMLLVGVSWNAPQAVAGDAVRVEIDGVGAVEFQVEQSSEGAQA